MTQKGSPRGRAADVGAQAAPPTPESTPPAVPPADSAPPTVAAAPVAAPLEAPPVAVPPPTPTPIEGRTDTSVVVELTRDAHEGVLDEHGTPVDLSEEFQLALATGNVVVLKRTLLETYRMPNSKGIGHRLLMTAGTSVPLEVANKLVQAQQRERALAAAQTST